MSVVLPFGRAIVDRQTGSVMGPIAPIFAEDWPFETVPDDEPLWRYMDLRKFEDLLRTSTFYFARPDRFIDPFEGRLSIGNSTWKSRSDNAFRRLYRVELSDNQKYHDVHRNVVFINCWHRNRRESRRMWDAYTSSAESVVIMTSAEAVRLYFPEQLLKFGIKYTPNEFPRTEFTHNALFFYKPIEYAFEREFRILRPPAPDEVFYSENPMDCFRRVSIVLSEIIHRVVTHRRASKATKRRVDELLRDYLPQIRRCNSSV
jgi:hypothetical protein